MKITVIPAPHLSKPFDAKIKAGMTTLFIILFTTTVHAAPLSTSLFFTPQESRDAEIQAAKSAPAGQGDITLSAIMYYAPDNWTLWIQGERWTPETTREDLRVLSVTADEVHLLWRGDGENGVRGEKKITLTLHQTYQISSGEIMTSP